MTDNNEVTDTEAANSVLDANLSKLQNAPSISECPPLCKDCHWVSIPHSQLLENYKCFAPENYAGINLLDGNKVYRYSCAEMRSRQVDTMCGVEGKWFKQATPKPILSAEITSTEVAPLKLVVPKLQRLQKLSANDLDNL